VASLPWGEFGGYPAVRFDPASGGSLFEILPGGRAPGAADSPKALIDGLVALERFLTPFKPVAIRMDPFWRVSTSEGLREQLRHLNYVPIEHPLSSPRSLEVEIDRNPEQLLHSFKKTTARQVRKALRLSLQVR
jgi:hypothetical protein